MTLRVHHLRPCLEGVIPASLATVAPDGTPNLAYLSQVQYVDPDHVALSWQFFSRTRENILANPRATLLLIHPFTAQQYRLELTYLRTEISGPLFEAMKAKLAGIASQSGMTGVFRLLGSDLYRVGAIEALPGEALPLPPEPRPLLAATRDCAQALREAAGSAERSGDLGALLTAFLDQLDRGLGIRRSMVLIRDGGGNRLYTVASHGYAASGVGSEIPVGAGVIGVACREGAPIRIGHMAAEYAYTEALRESAERSGLADRLECRIPFPGGTGARSQMAVPIHGSQGVLGVVYVESDQNLAFTYDHEDALVTLAGLLGMAMHLLQVPPEPVDLSAAGPGLPTPKAGAPVEVRHYAENGSIFLDGDYLIKGVAGDILWTLLLDHRDAGRTCFTNRELRLDPRVNLPDLSDNLEARLVLLAKRLVERDACIHLERTGRGRLCLKVDRPLALVDVG